MTSRNIYFLRVPVNELEFPNEDFAFTVRMIEKNDFSNFFAYVLRDKVLDRIVGIAIVSDLGPFHVKVWCLEISKYFRKRGYGSVILKEIKKDNLVIELNSLKEVEHFYTKNGFVKSSDVSPAHFIWKRYL